MSTSWHNFFDESVYFLRFIGIINRINNKGAVQYEKCLFGLFSNNSCKERSFK